MSFRNRLTLLFVVIVILPLIAVALVLFRLVAGSEAGQVDDRLGQAQRTAEAIYDDDRRQAQRVGRVIGTDRVLAGAVAARDRRAVQARLDALVAEAGADRVRAHLADLGRFEAGVGAEPGRRFGIAPATSRLVDASGRAVGRLRVSVVQAGEYAGQVERSTLLAVVVSQGLAVLASSTPLGGLSGTRDLPSRGEAALGGLEYRVTSFSARGFDGRRTVVRVLAETGVGNSVFAPTSVVVVATLLCFLLLAFVFALTVSRAFQHPIQRLLEAARRLGRGDFRVRVPTEGNDEFAELGSEFNAMAAQLELRLGELQTERTRLQGAIRRVGDSFAKGLDRDALLDILVQTAVDGVGAECGRATVREEAGGAAVEVARTGDLTGRLDTVAAAEATALEHRAAAEVTDAGTTALAQPLQASDGGRVLGVISLARPARPFTEPDKELVHYLANQAAVSSRTSNCTRRCSVRRSRTASPASPTIAASRRS